MQLAASGQTRMAVVDSGLNRATGTRDLPVSCLRQSSEVAIRRARCWAASPREANVDFAFDVRPFFSLPQAPDEVIESRRVSRAVLEPGEEIELLTDIASVMKASRNGG